MSSRVLIVDDERAMRDALEQELRGEGYAVRTAATGAEALDLLAREEVDVVLVDLRMPAMGGFELCRRAHEVCPDVPVVVMTAFGSLEMAIGAIRAGAYDFLTKPFDTEAARLVLDRAAEYSGLRKELRLLKASARESAAGFGGLVGDSQAMHQLFELLQRVRDSDVTLLISGESGTGKEIVARAVHQCSPRSAAPFVAINCAALPEPLLEAELFGHTRGAFTDAKRDRPGLFVQANTGTLLLDEVAELPLTMQAKLLRALQDRSVRPVGADSELPFDARILAATNRDLQAMVDAGRFREDLFFRLNVLEIEVPPLRSRSSDVLLLAQHHLVRIAARGNKTVRGFAPEAERHLLRYHWPGNVRELYNCVERAVALARFDLITPDDLPTRVREHRRPDVAPSSEDPAEFVPLEQVERQYVLRVLQAVGGHRTRAAKVLGLDRKTLYRKLDAWGVGRDE